MDDKVYELAKQARVLLVAEYGELGIEPQAARLMAQGHQPGGVHYAAVKAIIRALTPPEGYVLSPVEPTWQMNKAGENSVRHDVDPKRKPHPETARRASRNAYVSMLAARPEVP